MRPALGIARGDDGDARREAAEQLAEVGLVNGDCGMKVSLSTDLTGTYNCDFFVTMRIAYSLHRHRLGTPVLTNKRLVQLATIDGARDLGIDAKVGSLTPGKRADLITVRTTNINMRQMGDPYEALVAMGQPSDVDVVMVDGRILRRGGQVRRARLSEGVAGGRRVGGGDPAAGRLAVMR